MEPIRTTPSEENYIECIYRLSRRGSVRPGQLSESLGVARPSATRAISALAEKHLVYHKPYGDIRLTEKGAMLGQAIVRRHDCLTRLLVNILGMSSEDALREVHRLEHVLSDEVLTRLEVLVDMASASEMWLSHLRSSMEKALSNPGETSSILAGRTDLHQGDPNEQNLGSPVY